MLTGQMEMHKCVFEMSRGEMRLMVGTKGTVVIVIKYMSWFPVCANMENVSRYFMKE